MIDPKEKEIHLLDYWRILVKRRWVVYTSLAVVVSVTTLGSLLTRPVYTATVRLQIETSAPKILPFQEVMTSVPDFRNDFYQTQYGLIQSRRVAREVIASLHLDQNEEFRVAAPPDSTRPGPADKEAADRLEARRIDRFLARLKVAPVRNSRLVDVTFSSHDRGLSAAIANRVADTYIAFNSQAQYNTTERASLSLGHEIANLHDEIDAKEKELQAYASEHGIVALGEKQSITLKKLNDLSDSYTRAQATRIEKEARYAALKEASPADLPEVLDSRVVQDLTAKSAELERTRAEMSGKFKPEWPEMLRLNKQIEETHERIVEERQAIYDQVLGVAESAYRTARNQEEYLRRALEDQKRLTEQFNLKEIQYNNLRTEVANRRGTLDALVKRQSETSSSAGLNDPTAGNIRIVDPAEIPNKPSSPKIFLNFVLSLVTGLGLGLGLALFFEYLDKSIKTPEEMQQATGVPSIGLVPALRPEGGRLRVVRGNGGDTTTAMGPVELVTHEDPKSKVSEAFREVRTALLVSQAGGPPRSILITSTRPGEGKTAVALNLAITLAQTSRRVLLVDADLRRPRLHKLLDVENTRGLSNYLGGAESPRPEPVHTVIPRLDLIPSGPLPPNPADLLDSERFAQIQSEFTAQGYDHVIYDSPPILAVADAAIMAGRADAVILIVQAGVTPRDALTNATRRLHQVKAKIVGALLNQVDHLQQSYYGYSYKRYYGEEAAARPAPPAAPRPAPPRPDRDQQIQI